MVDVITGTPQLDATEMALIEAVVQKELIAKAKLAGTVRDVSMFAKPGSKEISFPKADSFTATNRGKSTKVDAQALTFELDTLLLNQDPTIKYIIDSFSELQSMVNAELESAKRSASAGALYVDSAIVTEVETGKGHTVNGVPADITAAAILEMQEFCLQNNGELEELSLIISVDQRSKMLALPEFTENQVYGLNPTPIQSGMFGSIYGMPVIVSNNLSGAQKAYVYAKDAIALGFQRGWRRDAQKDVDYGTGAQKVVWDTVFGVKAMQIEQGTEIDGSTALGAGESALIASLN